MNPQTREQIRERHQRIVDDNEAKIAPLVGSTLVGACYIDDQLEVEWVNRGELMLIFDNGLTLHVTSTGYDASEVLLEVSEAT